MSLKEQIQNYMPYDEQEERDKTQFLNFIDKFDDVLTRDNIIGHFTASAFIINKSRNKMVVVHHNINDAWIHPGGHADGDENLLSVAVKEAKEETALDIKVLDSNIFAIWSGPVKGHIKSGKYVSSHLHFDVIYLMEADDSIPLIFNKDESNGIKWITFDEAQSASAWYLVRPIHKKLIKKLKDK